jgi:exosortase/archaeosortase family protein
MMKKFILLYLGMLALLFLLFYADTSVISERLNTWQGALTLSLLDIGLEPGRVQGNEIIISPTYKLIITQACNGMIPILFYWASVIAYPVSPVYKLLWMIIGYVIISLINVLRILFVVQMVKGGREHFELAHDVIGNAILMATALLLFVLFIKTAGRSRRADAVHSNQ